MSVRCVSNHVAHPSRRGCAAPQDEAVCFACSLFKQPRAIGPCFAQATGVPVFLRPRHKPGERSAARRTFRKFRTARSKCKLSTCRAGGVRSGIAGEAMTKRTRPAALHCGDFWFLGAGTNSAGPGLLTPAGLRLRRPAFLCHAAGPRSRAGRRTRGLPGRDCESRRRRRTCSV
jgi:hypothetical protein